MAQANDRVCGPEVSNGGTNANGASFHVFFPDATADRSQKCHPGDAPLLLAALNQPGYVVGEIGSARDSEGQILAAQLKPSSLQPVQCVDVDRVEFPPEHSKLFLDGNTVPDIKIPRRQPQQDAQVVEREAELVHSLFRQSANDTALVREARSELVDEVGNLDQMFGAGASDVASEKSRRHRFPVARKSIGPPGRLGDRASHEGNRTFVLRDVTQLEEKPHRGVPFHSFAARSVPCVETYHSRQRLLQDEGHASAGTQEGVQVVAELRPLTPREAS